MDVAASVMSGMVNGRISRPSCHSLRVRAQTLHMSAGGDGQPSSSLPQEERVHTACAAGSFRTARVLGRLHPRDSVPLQQLRSLHAVAHRRSPLMR
jgi:hypothetical protein